MKTITRALLLLGVTVGTLYAATTLKDQPNHPSWVDCVNSSDCAAGHCCVINYERYSYPRCERMREIGGSCRPGGPLLTNGSRFYPDGLELKLDNVYLMFCPCRTGLTCSRGESTCHAGPGAQSNHLDSSPRKDD